MVKYNFSSEVKLEEGEEVPVVEKWDWNAVKNALDDAARKFLTSQKGFTEDHLLMNGRLVISTIAILFSAYALYDDWQRPFPQSKGTLIVCVLAYFLALLVLTLYTSYIERGCFAAAKARVGDSNKSTHWRVYSRQKPHSEDVYVFEIELVDENGRIRKQSFEKSVAKYVDEDGKLVFKSFYTDLAKYFNSFNSEEKKSK